MLCLLLLLFLYVFEALINWPQLSVTRRNFGHNSKPTKMRLNAKILTNRYALPHWQHAKVLQKNENLTRNFECCSNWQPKKPDKITTRLLFLMQSSLIIKILIQIIKQKFFFFFHIFFLFFGKNLSKNQQIKNKLFTWICSLCCSITDILRVHVNSKKQIKKQQLYILHQPKQPTTITTTTNQPTIPNQKIKHCWCCCLFMSFMKNQKTAKPKTNSTNAKCNPYQKQKTKTTKNQNKIAKQKSNQPLIGLPWVYARCLQTCRVWMPFCTSAGHCGPTRWWFHYGVHGRRKR